MSRLRFDLMPATYDEARKVIDESLRALLTVLNGGVLLREQFAGVLDTTVDVALLPMAFDVPGISTAPTTVQLLRAVAQRTEDGVVVSGGAVTWEWRSGRLVLHDVDALTSGVRYNVTLAAVV